MFGEVSDGIEKELTTMCLRIISLVGAFALAATAGANEVNLNWKFDAAARTGSGAYAPVAPVGTTGSSVAAWTCPNWVEAYASGGFSQIGFLLFFR